MYVISVCFILSKCSCSYKYCTCISPKINSHCNLFHCSYSPYIPAPDGRPTDFKVSQTSSRSLTLSWRPIDPLLQNGVITNYTLKCNSSMMYPMQVSPDVNIEASNEEYSVPIQELIPGTSYQCTVYANTSEGRGPDAVVTGRTSEESKIMAMPVFDWEVDAFSMVLYRPGRGDWWAWPCDVYWMLVVAMVTINVHVHVL